MAKGGSYEREICYTLSRWWTDGRRDDVFWRSNASGARATSRAKLNRRTAGQYGDITATDPIGMPLLDIAVIEVKRGYSTSTIGDLLDRLPGCAQQTWERWILTAERDADAAGSFAWLLIARRDRRTALVAMPDLLWKQLRAEGCFAQPETPQARMLVDPRDGLPPRTIHVISLERFLRETNAEVFRRLTRRV